MNYLLLLFLFMYPESKQDKVMINKTYEISSPTELNMIVDNIFGSVAIEPSDDNKVYLSLEIAINASSDRLMEQAKRDLSLGEIFRNDSLMLYPKAPFIKRCSWKNFSGFNMQNEPNYQFSYQFKLKVPKQAMIQAKTVNKGDVLVKNMDGPIDAGNVNGKIDIVNAKNVMRASTVNGDVTINFVEAPKEAIDFHTVNGDFNFELPKNFNAKVFFDSMNGSLYTSFDYQSISPKVERSTEGGKFKIGTKSGVEIGSGGPELSFKSINGDVYLKRSSASN